MWLVLGRLHQSIVIVVGVCSIQSSVLPRVLDIFTSLLSVQDACLVVSGSLTRQKRDGAHATAQMDAPHSQPPSPIKEPASHPILTTHNSTPKITIAPLLGNHRVYFPIS